MSVKQEQGGSVVASQVNFVAIDAATSGDNTLVSANATKKIREIGGRGNPDVGGTHSSSMRYGDAAAQDLPEDDTDTNDYNPWVEFTDDILFAKAGRLPLLGAG